MSSQQTYVTEGFESVETAFQKLHQEGQELGSAVCIYRHGKPVVDLWAGYQTPTKQQYWQRDTRTNTMSACKAMLALCLCHLVDKGLADFDDPVVRYWPEFASVDQARKTEITLRHLLSHSAGLPTIKTCRPGDVFNWQAMVSALERAPLLWPADEKTAYHAITFGHLVGEVVRRISGQMPSDYFAQNVAGPLDSAYGLKFDPEFADQTALWQGYGRWAQIKTSLLSRVMPLLGGWKNQYFRPCNGDYHSNSKAWRACEAPAVTGFGTARGLAKLYGMLSQGGALNGTRILSQEMAHQIAGLPNRPDQVQEEATGQNIRMGLGFFFNYGPLASFGPNDNNFGHCGMGGTTAFADVDNGIGFAYVCNSFAHSKKSQDGMMDMRGQALISALYDCL